MYCLFLVYDLFIYYFDNQTIHFQIIEQQFTNNHTQYLQSNKTYQPLQTFYLRDFYAMTISANQTQKHIKPSSNIAKFPYQLRMHKKYFLFSYHFSRFTLLFLLVYIMFFRTHLKISIFRYKYSLFSYLFHIVHIQKSF